MNYAIEFPKKKRVWHKIVVFIGLLAGAYFGFEAYQKGLISWFKTDAVSQTKSLPKITAAGKTVLNYWHHLTAGMRQVSSNEKSLQAWAVEIDDYIAAGCLDSRDILRQRLMQSRDSLAGTFTITGSRLIAEDQMLVQADLVRQGRTYRQNIELIKNENAWRICRFGNGSALLWDGAE